MPVEFAALRGEARLVQVQPDDKFWGNARDLGLTAVALLTFTGLVYEYVYLHELGIDFAAVEISPYLSLIAASKVAVSNAVVIAVLLGAGIVARFVIERYAKRNVAPAVSVATIFRMRQAQVILTILVVLLSCVTANATALRAVADLRDRKVFNVHISFKSGTGDMYPARLAQANADRDLFLVFNTGDHVFVLDQMKPGAIPMVPIGTVYELRKDDIASIETQIPSSPER